MTTEERLTKNTRIREKSRKTRQKRKSQVCRVYRVKIDISHLNEEQKTRFKMLFVEAKWLYNDILTFMNDHDINDYDSKTLIVHGLDKDRQPVTHELQYISSYQNKGGETKKYKPEIGIDMGIKTTITTSDGRKYKVLIGESERIKKCQRLIARRKKGSSNTQARPTVSVQSPKIVTQSISVLRPAFTVSEINEP